MSLVIRYLFFWTCLFVGNSHHFLALSQILCDRHSDDPESSAQLWRICVSQSISKKEQNQGINLPYSNITGCCKQLMELPAKGTSFEISISIFVNAQTNRSPKCSSNSRMARSDEDNSIKPRASKQLQLRSRQSGRFKTEYCGQYLILVFFRL
jgi:hypothetical protein